MIEILLTNQTRRYACKQARSVGALRGTYDEDGKGGIYHNYIGNLGELAWLSAFPEASPHNTYHHDLSLFGHTFEIKTKHRHVVPRPSYACNVQRRNDSQKADYYGFTSLLEIDGVFMKAYLVGYISTTDFKTKCTFTPAGTLFPNSNKPCRHDDWEVRINECKAPRTLYVGL